MSEKKEDPSRAAGFLPRGDSVPDGCMVIEAVDSHTAGEPTRMVTAGVGPVLGATMPAKRAWLAEHADQFRRALVLEPRGHDATVLAFLTEAVSSGSSHGVVFANDAGFLDMCGHGAIGVATCLVRLGAVAPCEPMTRVVLDTPAGTVSLGVRMAAGRPRSVLLHNVPSFVSELDVIVPLSGHGKVRADIAWGGNWFAFVRGEELGIEVDAGHLDELLAAARAVRASLADLGVRGLDPKTGERGRVDHVKIFAEEQSSEGPAARALTLCPGRAYDRSPCGTGTSAKLAVLSARGELEPGQVFSSRSIIGTEFRARILERVEVGGRAAVLPEIEGSAFVTGLQRFLIEADDPLRHGMDCRGVEQGSRVTG